MITVKYFIRPSKKHSEKKVSIYVRVANGRKYDFTLKTGWEILPSQFSNERNTINQRAKFSTIQVENIEIKQQWENKLTGLKQRIEQDLQKIEPSKDNILLIIDKYKFPDKYKPKKEKKVTLYSFIQEFIDKSPYRVVEGGEAPSLRTIQDYKKTFKDIKEFAAFKGYGEFDFSDIDKDFYEGFKSFLAFQKGYATNTIGKKIKVLKIFLNAAAPKYIKKEVFKDTFKVLKEEVENIALEEEELNKIKELDLSENPKLDKVRDLFLIGCWTGLRFSDWNKVKPENIENGILTLFQEKTGGKVSIPLLPVVEEILNKYDGNLPRPISNQKFNKYLKEVAKLADFKKAKTEQITRGGKKETIIKPKWQMVKTHTARRSFATNMYKAGIPTITIMAITGHKKESTFLNYIKIGKKEHAEKMRDMWLSSGNHLKVAK